MVLEDGQNTIVDKRLSSTASAVQIKQLSLRYVAGQRRVYGCNHLVVYVPLTLVTGVRLVCNFCDICNIIIVLLGITLLNILWRWMSEVLYASAFLSRTYKMCIMYPVYIVGVHLF